ncbi:MAG TPA: hypothetical protein VG733_07645 [Chthoniobacteraceae bacterium]|nr:hypothetical protein [Chthoniobacteraceae bacterium]
MSALAADTAPDADELDVYRVLFSNANRETIAIVKPDPNANPYGAPVTVAQGKEYVEFLKKELKGVEDATVDDFLPKWTHVPMLTPQSKVGVKLVILEQKEVNQIKSENTHSKEDWHIAEMRVEQAFQKRFSVDGLTSISCIGFNADRTQALVYMGTNGVGEGIVYLLERTGYKWVVKSDAQIWAAD